MNPTFYYTVDFDSLVHHGTKGMHWGERHYQNEDGTWTEAGKARRRANSRFSKIKGPIRLSKENNIKNYVKTAKAFKKDADKWEDRLIHNPHKRGKDYEKQLKAYTRNKNASDFYDEKAINLSKDYVAKYGKNSLHKLMVKYDPEGHTAAGRRFVNQSTRMIKQRENDIHNKFKRYADSNGYDAAVDRFKIDLMYY